MKLWILRPIEGSGEWDPWYDKTFGFVIRAECEKDARAIAAERHSDEGKTAWESDESSTCKMLLDEGDAGIVIQDSRWA